MAGHLEDQVNATGRIRARFEPSKLTAEPVVRLWPNSTIVCLATGPSVTTDDVAYVRGRARVIAVNDAYKIAPFADVLYAADRQWWRWHKGAPTFQGLKYTLDPYAKWAGVHCLQRASGEGISLDPRTLKMGSHSGYQAINLAVHLGARRIVLLGYDMQAPLKGAPHYFGHHPDRSKPPFSACLPRYDHLAAPLAAIGVDIVNCTRETAIRSLPRRDLREVLWP